MAIIGGSKVNVDPKTPAALRVTLHRINENIEAINTATGDIATIAATYVGAAAPFANDERLLRSDGAGRGAQASSVTLTDGGAMSGVASIDGGLVINEPGADVDFRIEGDSLTHVFFVDASAATENIALVATAAPNWQTMDRGLFIGEASSAPSGNPAAGTFVYVEGGNLKVRNTVGAITQLSGRTRGATSVADGGTITHGLGSTPTVVLITASLASQVVAVTAIGATNFTVAIKDDAGGPGTTQTIYWEALE